MGTPAWQVSGQYFETCNCDFLCPCITSNLTARPSKGDCTFAMAFRVERGHYGGTALDGLHFAIIGHTPGPMAEGNMAVGVITDAAADATQQQALVAIASGQAGGPMANLGPLVGQFLGAEAHPIRFAADGLRRSVEIPGVLEQAAEGLPGAVPGEPLAIDNTVHPANARLALARPTASRLHAFGLDWEDASGANNGHFAPFSWQGG